MANGADSMPYAIAVKAFIVRKGRALILKRDGSRPHSPGTWDLPGGRLEPGENVLGGLAREVREETGLSVKAGPVIGVHGFTRDDGQRITMLIFLCKPSGGRFRLDPATHTESRWAPVSARETEKLLGPLGIVARDYSRVFSKLKGTPRYFSVS